MLGFVQGLSEFIKEPDITSLLGFFSVDLDLIDFRLELTREGSIGSKDVHPSIVKREYGFVNEKDPGGVTALPGSKQPRVWENPCGTLSYSYLARSPLRYPNRDCFAKKFTNMATKGRGMRQLLMAKERKLDIFDVLGAVDRRDLGWLDRQPDDVKKEFAAPVVLRWASTVQGENAEQYLWLINDIANIDFHTLYQHPELQYKLIAMCGAGRSQRHQWITNAKVTKKSPKVHAFLSQFRPLASAREIDMLISLHTKETFTELVHASGVTPEEAKDLIDAFKKQAKG